jgi:hypothetical protein
MLFGTAQERADNEKIARTKAQLALAEKASELNECNIQRQGLQVRQCLGKTCCNILGETWVGAGGGKSLCM